LGQVGAGRPAPALGQGGPAEFLVLAAGRAPGRAPLVPALDGRGYPCEVAVVDAVGDEARGPVADRGGDPLVHGSLVHSGSIAHDCRGLTQLGRGPGGDAVTACAGTRYVAACDQKVAVGSGRAPEMSDKPTGAGNFRAKAGRSLLTSTRPVGQAHALQTIVAAIGTVFRR